MNPQTLPACYADMIKPEQSFAAILFADAPDLFPEIADPAGKKVAELRLVMSDIPESSMNRNAPSPEAALRIWEFAEKHHDHMLLLSCPSGKTLSLAVQAAILRKYEFGDVGYRALGPYNVDLYRLVLEAAGYELPPEPLVSMAVHHAVHPPSYLLSFMLSMERQRHRNWEVVVVIDRSEPTGSPEWDYIRERWGSKRKLTPIIVDDAAKNWGHPYRQTAIDNCRGDFIGMSNSDNYYAPGYIDSLLLAMEGGEVPIASCTMSHNYENWSGLVDMQDLGSWIAKSELVRSVPWDGENHSADMDYIDRLLTKTGGVIAHVQRVLYTHN